MFVCSLCLDSLGDRPQILEEHLELVVISLKCGHVFHRVCIEQWFEQNQNQHGHPSGQGMCPFCKAMSVLDEGLCIYLSRDEDESKRNGDLSNRLESELGAERSKHEELKLKYGESLSKIDDLERQIEDLQMNLAVQESAEMAVEKLEQEKADALNRIESLEATVKELSEKYEQLQLKQPKQEEVSELKALMND